MIKAIIFDCFGVLTTDGWLPFKRKFFGHDKELFERAGQLNRQANASMISYDEFIAQIGKMAGISAEQAQRTINLQDSAPNEELFGYIRTLKPRFKIGLLSNTSQNNLKKLFTDKETDLFDTIFLSYEEHVTKPEKEAYLITADRLGVKPSECIFIDDQERHCVGARATGMQAIHYDSFNQVKTDLEKILAADSRANN